MFCEFCKHDFKSSKKLLEHKKESVVCGNIPYASFSCKKCNISFSDWEDLALHIGSCTYKPPNSIGQMVSQLEADKEILTKKISSLESQLKQTENLLSFEKFRSGLFLCVLREKGINLDEFYSENEDGVHISQNFSENIPIFIHQFFKGKKGKKTLIEEGIIISDEKSAKKSLGKKEADTVRKYEIKSQKPKKETFRSLPLIVNQEEDEKEIDLVNTRKSGRKKKVKMDEKDDERGDERGDERDERGGGEKEFNETEFNEEKRELFGKLKTSRNPEAISEQYRKLHKNLLKQITFEKYVSFLESDRKLIQTLVISKKQETQEKIMKSCFTSMDKRILRLRGFYEESLDIDDIPILKANLELYNRTRKVFNRQDFSNCIFPYFFTVFNIEEILSDYFGKKSQKNLVYLNLVSSKEKDPFSFYSLDRITEGKRYWRLEPRLDEISKFISFTILTRCIKYFDEIYYSIFSHNTFTDKIKSFPIFKDLTQLLINIVILSRKKTFCNIMRTIIKNNCVLDPSKNDKFNISTDDPSHKKSFSQEEDSHTETVCIIKKLFVKITEEEAEELLSYIESFM